MTARKESPTLGRHICHQAASAFFFFFFLGSAATAAAIPGLSTTAGPASAGFFVFFFGLTGTAAASAATSAAFLFFCTAIHDTVTPARIKEFQVSRREMGQHCTYPDHPPVRKEII